jgi:hypothetical protein
VFCSGFIGGEITMEMNDEQKQRVQEWVDEGCGLSELQRRLDTELGVKLTYMDVRFLIIDLGLQLQEEKEEELASAKAEAEAADAPVADDSPAPPDPLGDAPGGVTVELDRIVKPGSVVSGTVTFSDGVTASWWLDQLGRLGIDAGQEGYSPSPEDVQAFQEELRNALSKRGL